MDEGQALNVGDQVPHFTVRTTDGRTVDYGTVWQTKNLVLLKLPPAHAIPDHALERLRALDAGDTRCVITADPVPGLAPRAALVADKWGEIVHIANEVPDATELAEWIEHIRQRCPECEGEAR